MTDIREMGHPLHHLWVYRQYREAGVPRGRARYLVGARLRGA